jgi:hypothetical protein
MDKVKKIGALGIGFATAFWRYVAFMARAVHNIDRKSVV